MVRIAEEVECEVYKTKHAFVTWKLDIFWQFLCNNIPNKKISQSILACATAELLDITRISAIDNFSDVFHLT